MTSKSQEKVLNISKIALQSSVDDWSWSSANQPAGPWEWEKPKCACGGVGWTEKKQRMNKRLEFIARLERGLVEEEIWMAGEQEFIGGDKAWDLWHRVVYRANMHITSGALKRQISGPNLYLRSCVHEVSHVILMYTGIYNDLRNGQQMGGGGGAMRG